MHTLYNAFLLPGSVTRTTGRGEHRRRVVGDFLSRKTAPCNGWEKCMRDWLSSCSPMSLDVVFDLPTGWTTCYSKVVKAFRFNACQAKHPNAQVEKSRSLVAALLKLDKKTHRLCAKKVFHDYRSVVFRNRDLPPQNDSFLSLGGGPILACFG